MQRKEGQQEVSLLNLMCSCCTEPSPLLLPPQPCWSCSAPPSNQENGTKEKEGKAILPDTPRLSDSPHQLDHRCLLSPILCRAATPRWPRRRNNRPALLFCFLFAFPLNILVLVSPVLLPSFVGQSPSPCKEISSKMGKSYASGKYLLWTDVPLQAVIVSILAWEILFLLLLAPEVSVSATTWQP